MSHDQVTTPPVARFLYKLTCQHIQGTPLGEVRVQSGLLEVLQVFYLTGNEGPYLGQHAPHSKVGLPLATGVFDESLQELQELLRMLTSRTNIIQKTTQEKAG